MLNLAPLLTAIKSASLAAKIGICVGSATIVAGGATGTIMLINHTTNNVPEEQQIVSDNSDDEPRIDSETIEPEKSEDNDDDDDDKKHEQTSDDKKDSTNTHSQDTQKSNKTDSSQSSQPSKPTEPVKKPDYNLNDKYYIHVGVNHGFYNKCWQTIGDYNDTWDLNGKEFKEWNDKVYTSECRGQNVSFEIWGIGHNSAQARDDMFNRLYKQYPHYHFYGGYGQNQELSETNCKKYSLSCGRW